jgi:CheY-like chemotaxis protein
VVLCDLQLPGPLSGYDVGRALRLQSQSPYLIAYSGYGQNGDRRQTEEAGFHEHLVKPSAIEDILMAIERGLQRKRQAPS